MSEANVYDRAHQLAQALKGSREYADYRLAAARLKSEKGAQNMLRDFRRRQFELQSKVLQGQEVSEEEQERFAKQSEAIASHAIVAEFLQSEYNLSKLLADIQKILSDAVEVDLDDGEDEESEEPDKGSGIIV